jgi:hypothetical protein
VETESEVGLAATLTSSRIRRWELEFLGAGTEGRGTFPYLFFTLGRFLCYAISPFTLRR